MANEPTDHTINNDAPWPSGFTRSDRRRFTSMVMKAAKRAGFALIGAMPHYTTEDGRQVNVHNLVLECAAMPRHEWAEHVRWWFEILSTSAAQLDDLASMSRDVAEASLRIRLLPDDAEPVPGMFLCRPSLPGLLAVLYLRRVGYSHNVKAEMLDQWGMGVDEAFAIARHNTFEMESFEAFLRNDVLLIDGPSNFASSRVLTLTATAEPVEGDGESGPGAFIVSVPSRHCFLAASLQRDGEPLSELLHATKRIYDTDPGATLPCAWFVDPATAGEWGEGAERIDVAVGMVDGEPHLLAITGPRFDEYANSVAGERPAA